MDPSTKKIVIAASIAVPLLIAGGVTAGLVGRYFYKKYQNGKTDGVLGKNEDAIDKEIATYWEPIFKTKLANLNKADDFKDYKKEDAKLNDKQTANFNEIMKLVEDNVPHMNTFMTVFPANEVEKIKKSKEQIAQKLKDIPTTLKQAREADKHETRVKALETLQEQVHTISMNLANLHNEPEMLQAKQLTQVESIATKMMDLATVVNNLRENMTKEKKELAKLPTFVKKPAPAPAAGDKKGDVAKTPATGDNKAPTTNAPAPVTNAPAPVTNAPAPVTNTPAPVTNAPAPVTNAPAPATNAPAPATNAPAPATNAPAPATNAPAPATNAPAQAPVSASEKKN